MKRIALFSLILCLLLSLATGCSQKPAPFDAAAATASSKAFPLTRIDGLNLTPPDSFTASEDGSAWYAPDYPSDGSCITIHTSPTRPQFASYTPENVKQALEDSYCASLDANITVTVDSFDPITISGFDALRLQYHFTYRDIKMICLQYLIAADCAYTVTCIQVADANWLSDFESVESSLSIRWALAEKQPA